MDWSPLAHDDPLPGDPPGVAATARRFRELAAGLGEQAARVGGVDPGPAWVGLAARRFAQARDRLAPQLQGVARRCESAADALQGWADDVERAQQAGLAARDRARAAEQDLHEAAVAADVLEAAVVQARQRDARDRLVRARRDFAVAVDDHRTAAARTIDRLQEADAVLDDPAWAIGPVAVLLGHALAAGSDVFAFVVTDRGLALNTAEAWRWEAYRQAGIDPGAWQPSRGLAALDEIVVAAWGCYADLFERRPDQFLWAGMATLAGGTFYAAFQDLHVLRRGLEDGSVAADEAGDVLRRLYPGLPGHVVDQLGDAAARDAAAFAREVRHVETTFLDMQRQIFDDLAWQHFAYEQGGLAAMEALRERGELEPVHLLAWREIDGGGDGIAQGNRRLLEHEQRWIIGDDYDRIRDHSPVAWAMTVGMSVVADSPVPGGRPFREVVPYEVAVDTPDRVPVLPDRVVPDRVPFTDVDVPLGGGVHVDTPDEVGILTLPLHNVSIHRHRWAWIERDMLPAWMRHVEAGTARGLVSEPLSAQAARQRLIPDGLLAYDPEGP